jgi:hypothetical protein
MIHFAVDVVQLGKLMKTMNLGLQEYFLMMKLLIEQITIEIIHPGESEKQDTVNVIDTVAKMVKVNDI